MTAHLPRRPDWTCAACDRPWPCPPRKAELLATFGGHTLSLHIEMALAAQDALRERPDVSEATMYDRFIGWVAAGRDAAGGP